MNKPAVRRHATAKEKAFWAELAQLLMLDGLATSENWEANDVVFHGGTSLHMSWNSPRHSEDLDFLIKRDLLGEMGKTMEKVVEAMRRRMVHLDPDLIIEIRDKSNAKMGRFNISISKANVMGKSMVKSEFWGVDSEYLDVYKSRRKIPVLSDSLKEEGVFVKLRAGLQTATLDSVFCDKVVAMAGRPFIKWRDAFDLWWISQSREFQRPEPTALARRILYYASAYRNDPNSDDDDHQSGQPLDVGVTRDIWSLPSRLRAYAMKVDTQEMIEASKTDLKRFLTTISGSTEHWDKYWPENVEEMVKFAAETAREVAGFIEAEIKDWDEDEPAPVTAIRMRSGL